MSTQHIIECNGLVADTFHFEYTGEALNFHADAGSIISLIGPDNTGKSDWLKAIAGIHYPQQGSIKYMGTDATELDDEGWSRLRRNFAYVRGDTSLLSAANGLANVMIPARYHKLGDDTEIESKALNLILEIGANQALDELPAFIRRDQRFRLAVARALMLDPKVLFLDNPFVLLDAVAAKKFKTFLLRKVKEDGLTVILVTQDINFTVHNADKILFITSEKVYSFDSVEDFQQSNIPAISEFLEKSPVS